jgi:23S rRNA (guanosine2251-2'-O)-methyltransferase
MTAKKLKKEDKKYDLIYGPHAIIECLKAGRRRLASIYTTKAPSKALQRIEPHLPKRVNNTQYVSRDVLDRMAGTTEHSNVIALVSPFSYASTMFSPSKYPFIVMLDGITDVRNLGAILRSAYCSGIDGVVICHKGDAPMNPAVFKTSAGLAEYISIYKASSPQAAMQAISKAGYTSYMAVPEKGQNVMDVAFKKPMCLVIGSEETGISPDILKAGNLITIPQRRPDISYNASVAAGVLMFAMTNKK